MLRAVRQSMAVMVLAALPVLAQEPPAGTAEQAHPAVEQQRRPTLGPAPAPSLYGPKTSNTTDPRKLLRVHKIYIERIDNALDEELTGRLAASGRFQLVGERKDADAILRGNCSDYRRLKQLRSEVYLNDPQGAPIWQDSLREPFNPPSLAKAVSATAQLISKHLQESVTEAEHR